MAWAGHAAQRSALAAGLLDIWVAKQRNTTRRKKDSGAPYLARQMSDFGFRQTLEIRTLGCA